MQSCRIGVLGGAGFLGQHLCAQLGQRGLVYHSASRATGVDARQLDQLLRWIHDHRLTHVINLAADCGGIGLNQRVPADLWLASTLIGANVLQAAQQCRPALQKLTMLGTVCSYGATTPTPFREADLMWHGFPEPTNAPYGMAKLAALFGVRAYRDQYGVPAIYLVSVNMYGEFDHFEPESSHVIPALIRKFLEAHANSSPTVTVWGTGVATREFLYAGDAAQAIIQATLEYDSPEPINLGSGSEISILELAQLIAEIVGYSGQINWDRSKPDGQLRRCLDTTKARQQLGWEAQTLLRVGLARTIAWYRTQLAAQLVAA